MKDLTKGRPLKVIALFCIPVLLGAIFNLFYNIADTRIIGSFLGADALAAVGSISTLGDFANCIVIGFTGGFGIVTAQLYGMKKPDEVRRSFYVSIELGALITVLIVIVYNLLIDRFIVFLNIPESTCGIAKDYIMVIINGIIFSMIYNVLLANLRAIGDTVTPLIILILSSVLNVGLNIFFVKSTDMGVRGVALATILSQAIAAVTCFVYMLIKYPSLRPRVRDFVPNLELIRNLMTNGISMALMSTLVSIGTLTLQITINSFGENIIVAHTAARKISSIYMMPNSVLGTCMATYCGQNHGAGREDRIKIGIRDSLLIAYAWAVLVMITSHTVARYLVIGVTGIDTEEIVQTACLYLHVDTLFYLTCHTISVLRSALQGMGDKLSPVISSILELTGKVLIARLLAPAIGYWGIIWAEPIVWTIMVIPLIVSTVRRVFPRKKKTATA